MSATASAATASALANAAFVIFSAETLVVLENAGV